MRGKEKEEAKASSLLRLGNKVYVDPDGLLAIKPLEPVAPHKKHFDLQLYF